MALYTNGHKVAPIVRDQLVPTQSKSMTLGSSAPSTVTPDSGYALSSVSPSIDTSVIKADNIAQGVTILGVEGTHSGGGNLKDISPVTKNGVYSAGNNLTVLNSITLTGNAYIPTNINVPEGCSWDIDAKFKVTQTMSGTSKSALFGSLGDSYYVLLNQTSNSIYLYMNGEYAHNSAPQVGTEYAVVKTGNTVTINGSTITKARDLPVVGANLLDLFAYNEGTTHSRVFIGVFEYLKFIDNGTTTHWFIPVKDENNIIKIYDKVTCLVYDFVGSGVTAGTESTDTVYNGFASPLTVNVCPTKWGASIEDLFNTSVSETPTLHDVVVPANQTNISLQYAFMYSTIKSFTMTSPFTVASNYNYRYALAYNPYLESVDLRLGTSWTGSSGGWQYFAYQCTGLKHVSISGVHASTSSAFSYMFYGCTSLEEVVWDYNPSAPYLYYANQFSNTFVNCTSLTKATFRGLKRSNGNATNAFNLAFRNCNAMYDNDINHFRFPELEYIGINSGTSNYGNLKYAFETQASAYYGKCSIIFPEMYAIYNRHSTATYGHFAYNNALGKIYLPKFTADGTTGQYIFNNCTYLTEIHFGIENQATVEALDGYSSKFGATNATLYFDMPNHITVNGVVYDRSGAEYDYDTSHYSWKNGSAVIYTTNAINPAVGDTTYTKSGSTYISTGTITAIS